MRTKEFLSSHGVDFAITDIVRDPDGLARLMAFGVRTVPVLARGTDFIFCQSLEDVVRFVGLDTDVAANRLPADVLVTKYLSVLRVARAQIGVIPADALEYQYIPPRQRSLRQLGHHVFGIADAFLRCARDGDALTSARVLALPPDDMVAVSDITDYADNIVSDMDRWWAATSDRAGVEMRHTYFGDQSVHQLLERSAWHSAQHVRQLSAILDRLAVASPIRLADTDLAGLPLPAGLWE